MSLLSAGAVTVAGYQVHTGDDTTAASAVSAALIEGQSLVEEHLRRLLEHVERTDDFTIYHSTRGDRVYPNAWPITDAELEIDGRALVGASADSGPFVGIVDVPQINRATVVWTGGFTADTLPVTLRHAIYDLANKLVTDTSSSSAEVDSVSLGDASVKFREGGSGDVDSFVPGLSRRIDKYRNRWAS